MVFNYLFEKIKKTITACGDKKNQTNLKLKEYLCFLIKSLEDCLKKISSVQELSSIIIELKSNLSEIICLGAENEDIMIRNQAQQLFTPILNFILDHHLPLREELEALLVKVVLKPALQLAKKLQQDLLAKSVQSPSA